MILLIYVLFNVIPGQNKNIYLLLMFMFLVQKGILKEVHMDYMVSGHSYLPCDRGFGVIETACRKKQKIQCPDHYVKIIEKITNTNVTKMTSADFLDVKSLKERITKRTTNAIGFGFAKASRFEIHADYPWQYKLCQGDDHVWVDLQKRGVTVPISRDPIPKKYPEGKALKIKPAKLEHVLHFHDFLEQSGRRWIQEVVRQQSTANDRPQDCPDEVTPDENIQCDDQFNLDYAPAPDPRETEENLEDHNEDIGSDAADEVDD